MRDLDEGLKRKFEGMNLASDCRTLNLEKARALAGWLAEDLEEITADDVTEMMAECDLPPLGNAAGSLFRGPGWEFTGFWRQSDKPSNHGRWQRLWRKI